MQEGGREPNAQTSMTSRGAKKKPRAEKLRAVFSLPAGWAAKEFPSVFEFLCPSFDKNCAENAHCKEDSEDLLRKGGESAERTLVNVKRL